MTDCMMFPDDWRDFLKDYSFVDSEDVYTNGSLLIPVFRVEQLIEHLMESQFHEQEPRVMTLKQITENHGLTPDGVDYALNQYQIVISEITHGLLSKLTYDAHDVLRIAQERWCDTCELKEAQEPMQNGEQYQCNRCKYYEGVHNTEGHAPCSFWNIGGVMWNDYCSRFQDFRIGGEVK